MVGKTPARPPRRCVRVSIAPLIASALLVTTGQTDAKAQETALWYIGTYTNHLLVWDEASERVIDRIETRHAIPADITLSERKDRLYVRQASAEIIEIVDIAAGRVIDEFTLSEGNVRVRISGFAPHPSNRKAVMQVMRYTKHPDRYTIEGPFIVEYDLEAKQVTDTITHPDDAYEPDTSGYGLGFRYAPDGGTLYFYANDIIAVDADTYEEIDRWQMSEPLESGLGRTTFGTNPGTYDEDGVSTSLFRMTDPAQNRRMMGISRARLSEQEVDFFTLGTAEPLGSFTLAPGGEKGYALYSEIGQYEFWEFDLVTERVTGRHPFPGRPRMGLQVSADGERLFVYVAGQTIDVYDSGTFELIRSVELGEDMTEVAIVPGPGPAR